MFIFCIFVFTTMLFHGYGYILLCRYMCGWKAPQGAVRGCKGCQLACTPGYTHKLQYYAEDNLARAELFKTNPGK